MVVACRTFHPSPPGEEGVSASSKGPLISLDARTDETDSGIPSVDTASSKK
jgi:hypothetical protein